MARLVIAGLVFAVCAVLLAPPVEASMIDTVAPPEPVVRASALGRTYAAVDVLWLKTVQLIGTQSYADDRYRDLEQWIDVMTSMDPRFEMPYFYGTVLLVTSSDQQRLAAVDKLLARGEQALPDSYSLPMNRGFIAYFGRLDAKAGAEHYRAASKKPDAPPFVGKFADRLETQANTCGAMQDMLKAVAQELSDEQGKALFNERFKILEQCIASKLNAAEIQWTLEKGTQPTVEDLVGAGRISAAELVRPQGMCWTFVERKAKLQPCTDPASDPSK